MVQRLTDLGGVYNELEKRTPVEVFYSNLNDIQAHIRQLEAERGKLLLKYTALNPVVRDIDRKLLFLGEQLRMPEP